MPPSLEDQDEDFQGETIVVKGEYNWARPSSSPDSGMSAESEPLVNHLLAQMNSPQRLESPGGLEDDISTEIPNPTPSYTSRSSLPTAAQTAKAKQHRPNGFTMEERLQMMPEKRPMPWRPGVEPGADNETGGESRRKQIRFGCLLATRGEVQTAPCNSCANGRGKFSVCVALEGFFKGACASCQLSGRPNRCSIKINDGEDIPASTTPIAPVAPPPPPTPVATPVATPYTSIYTPGGIQMSNGAPQPPPQSRPPPPSDGQRSSKRRRTDKVPDWESQRPQWEQELGDSHARQQMTETVQRPWASVNPLPISTQGSTIMNGANGARSTPQSATDHPARMSWAAVNQPSIAPGPGPPSHKNGESNGAHYRNKSEHGGREDTVMNDEGSVALIDTLPKHKQRQVYGFLSGLQGGIDNLQRELDSLKKALGINDDE